MKAILCLLSLVFLLTACFRVRTEHRVDPIVITMNVNLRIVQELNEFFDDLDAQSAILRPPEPETE
jgi:hypothetical protein